MNTEALMPFDAIAINEVIHPLHPEYPGLCGTGFFCTFPPFEHIFYVTARHCLEYGNVKSAHQLSVRYSSEHNEYIEFSDYMATSGSVLDDNSIEDVLVFKVSDNIGAEKTALLKLRALELWDQDTIDAFLAKLCASGTDKVRTIGYPRGADSKNEIDYSSETPQIVLQPRGFNGYLRKGSTLENRYLIEDLNWKNIDYDGFSGSPVLALCPRNPAALKNPTKENVATIVIGVVLTASNKKAHFLSINVVTDLIAAAINNDFKAPVRA